MTYELFYLPISFHPVAALVKRWIEATRELACDELVTERLLDPFVYARSLVRIAGSTPALRRPGYTLGVFDANDLEERIMRLIDKRARARAGLGRLLLVVASLVLAASCVAASALSLSIGQDKRAIHEDKPNFSGRWEMDEAKSELGPSLRAGGYRESLLIDHQEPKLKIHYSLKYEGQELTTVFHITADGTENINQSPIGEERSRTHWEGERLVTEWKIYGDVVDAGKIVRVLSKDGKTQNVEYQKGTKTMKLVFMKKSI